MGAVWRSEPSDVASGPERPRERERLGPKTVLDNSLAPGLPQPAVPRDVTVTPFRFLIRKIVIRRLRHGSSPEVQGGAAGRGYVFVVVGIFYVKGQLLDQARSAQ